MSSAGRDALVAMLSRLKSDLSALDLRRPEDAQATLQQKYPLVGDYLVEVRRLCERGVEEGWLCTDERGGIRYSRLTGPSKWFPYSVDAVELDGDGPPHGHPKGEINIGWQLDGDPKFCGQGPGWAVFAPGSHHVPSVCGGKMFLLYFLPNGAIEWGAAKTKPRKKAASKKRAARKVATKTAKGTKKVPKKTAAKASKTSSRKSAGAKASPTTRARKAATARSAKTETRRASASAR